MRRVNQKTIAGERDPLATLADETSHERNPFVFIVGCPRSGTTLLRRMVDAHPLIAITRRETHWIPIGFRKQIGLTQDGVVTADVISWLTADAHFRYMGISREELEEIIRQEGPLTYALFVSRVFDLYAAKEGKALAGDKTPGYARQLPLLHALWPAARFIHLIRDGRDVYLSFRDWAKSGRVVGRFLPWPEHPATSAALFWEWHVKLARRAGSELGAELYHEVCYETLVSEPAAACAALCAFLEVPFSDRMLLADERRPKVRPGADSKHARLPPTPGLRDWRARMPPEDVERFEAVSGDLLEELGYRCSFREHSSASREEARRLRELHVPGLPARRQAWPEG
jgi:hypothetical protein